VGAGDNQANPFTVSQFVIQKGTLSLEKVCFFKLKFDDAGIISEVSNAVVRLRGCEFDDINRIGGDGSVVSVVVGSEEKLFIQNCSFEGCLTESGNGGGVSVALEEGGRVEIRHTEKALLLSSSKGMRKESEDELRGCVFSYCEAEKQSVGKGGGLWMELLISSLSLGG
jgi:hypothetical protein